ncbi:alkene reductase [Rathayibacter sp. VKM Ac-2760]|uniref:alkene reductase n=1 Tax=Rathayibacter sp. VKM Ac-2760 TaxID=2609253 RepID=UPI0013165917|nr:alkene reductase [Rathayibacter sp. VKM Ac-2760]QHC61086.1 alkene reductase [Rathayibacter sp. VKM Ac-2760]
MAPSPTLWQPHTLGRLELPHRLALAPMTRSRARADGTPHASAAEYYRQRAGLGLLISEGTQPSAAGQGFLNSPGIHSPEQIEGWRAIADAVHEEGGALFIQVMHAGRVSHPDNTANGSDPVGPSAIGADVDMFTPTGPQKTPVPRELTTSEVEGVVEEFRHAAASAVAAGADGVELHAANGFLLHQFLAPNANVRSDRYGGSVENRARLVVEVARAAAEEIGADRVGVRISPAIGLGGLEEGTPSQVLEQYLHLVSELAPLGLAYLHVLHLGDDELLRSIRSAWPTSLLVLRPGQERDRLGDDVEAGLADVTPVGRLALANPDLVERLREGAALTEADPATFYGGGDEGYVDYPVLARA